MVLVGKKKRETRKEKKISHKTTWKTTYNIHNAHAFWALCFVGWTMIGNFIRLCFCPRSLSISLTLSLSHTQIHTQSLECCMIFKEPKTKCWKNKKQNTRCNSKEWILFFFFVVSFFDFYSIFSGFLQYFFLIIFIYFTRSLSRLLPLPKPLCCSTALVKRPLYKCLVFNFYLTISYLLFIFFVVFLSPFCIRIMIPCFWCV